MTNQSNKSVQQQRDQIDDNHHHQTPPTIDSSTPSSIAIDETPQIDRWSRDFHSLIDDRDGINLFRKYTAETGLDYLLNFYFACIGLKSNELDLTTKNRLISVIFKRFILKPKILELSTECQQNLIELYKNQRKNSETTLSSSTDTVHQLDENTFNEAFDEIEARLSGAIYQNFLKSRIFLEYINRLDWTNTNVQQQETTTTSTNQNEYDHQQTKESNSSTLTESFDEQDNEFFTTECNNNNYHGNRYDMPVIDETSEDGDSTVIEVVPKFSQHQQPQQQHQQQQQQQHSKILQSQQQIKSLSSSNNNNKLNSLGGRERLQLQFYDLENPPHPYHVVNRHAQYSSVQYNSKKDSEIESISSSDSSFVCSRDRKTSSTLRNMNSSSLSSKTLTQRFQRPPPQQIKNQLLPTENPDEFARKLIEKLNKVRSEQETDIKLSQALKSFERAHSPSSLPGQQQLGNNVQQREAGVGKVDGKNNNNNSSTSSSSTTTKSNYRESGLGLALKNIDFSTLKNEGGQAILDKHFAQVFDTPNADSPSTSNQSSSAAPYTTHNPPPPQIHYYPQPPPVANITNSSSTIIGSIEGNSALHSSLPPPSPLSPTHQHFIAQLNSLSINNNNSCNTCIPIPAYVKFSNEEVPHKLTLMGPNITLSLFKQQIPTKRGGLQEFFFKRQSSESEKLDCGSDSLWIKIKDDHIILPLIDGKIHARVELL